MNLGAPGLAFVTSESTNLHRHGIQAQNSPKNRRGVLFPAFSQPNRHFTGVI